MSQSLQQLDTARIPRHIAIIMDGNGRWARSRGGQRTDGHIVGVDSVKDIITAASDLGVEYLTLYAFSTENWNRPKEEVEMLLNLIVTVLTSETEEMKQKNVQLHMIGDSNRLTEYSRRSLENSIAETAECNGLKVYIAISYSSRWEITDTMQRIAKKLVNGEISTEDINETLISNNLATAGIPDPDLMIRTGGEKRISNYLLWQAAYSELYFTDTLWPDFRKDSLIEAIIDFQSRERRYGLTSDQVKK